MTLFLSFEKGLVAFPIQSKRATGLRYIPKNFEIFVASANY
jgi:hypothetical protein